LNVPTSIPKEKQLFLEQLVGSLSKVPSVAAVVLGGSYASGTQHGASDLDLGLYYFEAEPFSVEEIKRVANDISRPDSLPTVTGFYEWGAWVNGGAWIETEVGKVDFLYRNLEQVQKTIQAAHQGIIQHDYDQQPTNGFYSVGYLAETRICVPLYDPGLRIAELKKQVEIYPPKLNQKIIMDSLWGAEFTLKFARAFAEKADIYNTVGCLTRVAAHLTQTLFAINEKYFLSDKKVMETIASFEILPDGYVKQILSILACPGGTRTDLIHTITGLEVAWQNVRALVGEIYQPKF
jgi:predicted nucleotidyltransferase